MVGKILEKRYVVLEEVGQDGTGFRYLVYDMNSLQRIHLRVDPDLDGQLSGNTFELVDIDQPLASSASAKGVEQARPRTPTPRGFHPTSKEPEQHTVRLPREVALESASTSQEPLTLLEELKATRKDPDSDLHPDAPVERPLAEALALALKAASTVEPAAKDPLSSTQPIDLASAEEIVQVEQPIQRQPEPPGDRPRVQTKVLEAAWFAQGDQMEEEEEVVAAPQTPGVDHDRLARQAAELSADEYRKYALDLPPPAPPPIRIVEAFLDAKPDLASLVSLVSLVPAEPVAPEPVAPEPVAPEPVPVRPATPTPTPAPAPTTTPALQRSHTPPPTTVTPTPRPTTTPPPRRSMTPTPPVQAHSATSNVASPKPEPDLGSAPTVASLPPLDQILRLAAPVPEPPPAAEPAAPPANLRTPVAASSPVPAAPFSTPAPAASAPAPLPPAPLPPAPLPPALPPPPASVAPVAASIAWSAARPTSRSSSISEHALGSRLGAFVIGLLVGGLVGGLGTCLLTPRIPPPASAPRTVVPPPVVRPSVATPAPPPEPTPPAKVEAPDPTPAPSLNGRERKRLNHMLHIAARFARRHRWKQARHYAIKVLQLDPAHHRAHHIKSHAEQMLGN